MLEKVNQVLQKFLPIITPTAAVMGILLSQWLAPLEFLVPWVFAFMTFAGSLGSNFTDLKHVFLHPAPLFVSLLLLHLVMPIVSFSTGHLVFRDEPYFITGLVLAFLIPTGITSLIWVSIYKGNIPLTLSIILLDTFLAPFLVPSILYLFVGSSIAMNGFEIMVGLLWMIVIPSILGMVLNQWSKGKVHAQLSPKLAPITKICMGIIVGINSAVVAPFFLNFHWQLVKIFIMVVVLVITGYLLGFFSAKLLKANEATTVSITFNSGMRNINTGVVIAVAYFPPAVAVPVIIGMLIQQVMASFAGNVLQRYLSRGSKHEKQLAHINES